MLDAVNSLQTNVIATVRRDRTDLPKANNGLSEQAHQQSTPFILNNTLALQARAANPLDSQIAELMAVAQASAYGAAGIEPKGSQVSAFSRATAAYELVSNSGYAKQKPILSLAI